MLLQVPRPCLRWVTQEFRTHLAKQRITGQNYTVRFLRTSCVQCDAAKNKKGTKVSVKKESSSDHSVSVFDQLRKEQPKALTMGQKVAENTKTSIYGVVIIAGFGVVLYLAYMIFSEMFSSVSPTSVFKLAMKKLQGNEKAVAILGSKIKGFGDPHSRTNKRLQHQPYEVAGTDYLRVIFHVEGSKRNGVVQVDLKKTKKGWKTRYIILNLEGYPPGRVSIEDNTFETDSEDLPEIDYSEIDKEFK